ncbi:hypothetical protein B4U80_13774 [Leptotrombidium deliense]|uniref:Ig-like domain-containing protein n=1 Tax=Leptotrombidium deliense TaxID=299467 RepID=A0A443SFE0_9ACAR|nr:hypothetical protein B4U80_13774 [Leptotrombidium deliense]
MWSETSRVRSFASLQKLKILISMAPLKSTMQSSIFVAYIIFYCLTFCFAKVIETSQNKEFKQLVVKVDKNITKFVGEFLVLGCPFEYDTNPKYYWFKNNSPKFQKEIEVFSTEQFITIASLISSHQGYYMCIVEDEDGEANYTYFVNVKKHNLKPSTKSFGENLIEKVSAEKREQVIDAYAAYQPRVVNVGENVTLECIAATKYKRRKVNWFKDNAFINRDPKLKPKSKLVLLNVQLSECLVNKQ